MNTFTIILEEFTKNNELNQNSVYGKMVETSADLYYAYKDNVCV